MFDDFGSCSKIKESDGLPGREIRKSDTIFRGLGIWTTVSVERCRNSLRTMMQIKALNTRKMCCFKTQVHLSYPLALNRNKWHLKQLKILQHCKPPDPHCLLSDVMSIVIS